MAVRHKGRRRRRAESSVPMAPMIDMVFLLLVFFMTASAMSQSGSKVELELPEVPSSQVPTDLSNRLELSIDAQGAIFFGSVLMAEDGEVETLLRSLSADQPGVKLRIRADKRTDFAHVKRVMRLAARAGLDSYLYAAYQNEG